MKTMAIKYSGKIRIPRLVEIAVAVNALILRYLNGINERE